MPATVAGTSDTISARSNFFPLLEPLPVPMRLMSQKTPETRKPCGAATEPAICFNLGFMELHRRGFKSRPSDVIISGELSPHPSPLPIRWGEGILRLSD